MLKRTHRLIMIQFHNSTPIYDAKLGFSNDLSSRKLRLKWTTFVNFQPLYDSQVRHFMGKVTAIRRVLAGEREVEVLWDDLDLEDSMIIAAILRGL